MGQKVPGTPLGDTAPLKISKKLSPQKTYYFKILQHPPPLISGQFIP